MNLNKIFQFKELKKEIETRLEGLKKANWQEDEEDRKREIEKLELLNEAISITIENYKGLISSFFDEK